MVRWQPGTSERLQAAALELFATRGFEQTTTAEIAAAVGVTERTFFRHFSDKREALFDNGDAFLHSFLDAIVAVPADAAPLQIMAAALQGAATWFPDERRAHSRRRQAVIDSNPALQEREQHKFAVLATSLAEALRARGVPEPAATLAAQSATTVFTIAFVQWLQDGEERSLAEIEQRVLAELRDLTAA